VRWDAAELSFSPPQNFSAAWSSASFAFYIISLICFLTSLQVLSKLRNVIPVDNSQRRESRRVREVVVRDDRDVQRERQVRQREQAQRESRQPERQVMQKKVQVSAKLVDRLQRAEETLRADKLKQKRDEKKAEKLLSQ
jgi:hypothetical protein